MKKYAALSIFLLLGIWGSIQAQTNDKIIQITGVTMSADSLYGVPDVTILVKNKERGTYSNAMGVFSLVCEKGDTLNFSLLGYKTVDYVIPESIGSKFISMIQLMVQDTFYIPETIVSPILSKEDLMYAIKYKPLPEDEYAIMERNTNPEIMSRLRGTLPRSGGENQAIYQQRMANQAVYYGQQAPVGIFNIFKWNEFFQAWKRGDFRRKK